MSQSFLHILSQHIGAAFAAQGLPPELGAVRVSDRPDLAQFQCNGAMAAAKIAGKKPREVAEQIIEFLKNPPHPALSPAGRGERKDGIFRSLEIAGPGFINITVEDSIISNYLAEIGQNETMGAARGAAQTALLDYGGPNIAKPMHVGHLRSSIIGDSLRRILAFAGYKTIADIHMGDWGLPMGQVISELQTRHPVWPYFDEAYTGAYPAQSPVTMEDLEEIYPASSAACKADPARLEQARQATRALQDGRRGYRALWRHFINVSIAGMKANFDALGVQFDLWQGESDVHDLIAPMVEALKKQGMAVESDGALVVNVAQDGDKKEMPPLILYKRDGAVMYGTTDLATIVQRLREYSPAKIIYVVDQRQGLHFEQVFRAARKAGIAPPETELTHAGFGMMNGPDGKPFKTRAGGVMKLEDLIAMAVEKAQARLADAVLPEDITEAERDDIARKVAIAAIKFADLQNNRVADYVFDLDRMTAFEGKTGPYVLYQAVRIQSLLKKAGDLNPGAPVAITEASRSLALSLTEFPDHFAAAVKDYAPHILCDHAYKLAQGFSAFYAACHILSEPDPSLRAGYLALCALTHRQIVLILGLLGLAVPERM